MYCLCGEAQFYVLSEHKTYGMGPSIVEVGLPTFLKPFCKHYHRYNQNCISVLIHNPIKLTMKINHHTMCQIQDLA